MKPIQMIAAALILAGAGLLAYDHFSYTTTEEVLKIGPISATAERTHTVAFPPLLGWALVIGGIGALAFSAFSKKS